MRRASCRSDRRSSQISGQLIFFFHRFFLRIREGYGSHFEFVSSHADIVIRNKSFVCRRRLITRDKNILTNPISKIYDQKICAGAYHVKLLSILETRRPSVLV